MPLLVGGMGVDISTPALALAIARQGGIGHLSDAMVHAVMDRHTGSHFVRDKWLANRACEETAGVTGRHFDLDALRRAVGGYVRDAMGRKRGTGGVFMNIMEKLTMGNPRETLKARIEAALDEGIDGITLGAGLHLSTFDLIKEHARFRDALFGIIVSSARALKVFLNRAVKAERMPDYIVVEGPLAGGHLGFPLEWQAFNLSDIFQEIRRLLESQGLSIPVIAAGGIFTGSDAVAFLEQGAAGVQVATRFTVARESGLPDPVKQAFFTAEPEDVEVNMVSPTGYPMRMLKQSPAITARVAPKCEAYGYVLDEAGACSYRAEYLQGGEMTKTCLCAMMHGYQTWTCGHTVSRLKETTHRLPDGRYLQPTAEHIFRDYAHSTGGRILLPPKAPSLRDLLDEGRQPMPAMG